MKSKNPSPLKSRSTNGSNSRIGIEEGTDSDFRRRKEKLAEAFVDASKTLEDLGKGLTGDEMAQYYFHHPELVFDTIFGQERATLESALAREVEAIRSAPDEQAVKLALARGEGAILTIRALNVLEFLAKGLFHLRDDLRSALEAIKEDNRERILELSKEASQRPFLSDKEKEVVSRLARYYDEMAESDERGKKVYEQW